MPRHTHPDREKKRAPPKRTKAAPKKARGSVGGKPKPKGKPTSEERRARRAEGPARAEKEAPRAPPPRVSTDDPRVAPRPVQKRAPIEGPTRCGTVALIGRPNVGKSTLLNAILGQKIAATTHKPQTTRRALRGVETRGSCQLIFIDTPGLHRLPSHKDGRELHAFMMHEALEAARGVDVLAFMVEARGVGIAKEDAQALEQLDAQMRKDGQEHKAAILVINKIDMFKDKRNMLPLLTAWHATGRFKALIPVCARTGDGIDIVVEQLAALLPEGPFVFDADAITDASERDIAAELIREKVMLELQQELPYRATVVVEEFDESRRADERKPIVHVAAVIHVEKDSQKAMVIGKSGQRIKAIGQRAREELQRLLDCQVMLELLVRVEPEWTTSGTALRKLGYRRE